MFRLYGEQKILHQWDLNRKLIVGVPCQEVHITDGSENAPVLKPYDLDGQTVVEIPNIFLQSSRSITAYAWVEDGVGGFTRCSKLFHILPRPKPDDYVYTETEVLNYSYLDKRIKDLEGEGLANAVADYLKENPVKQFGTDETLTLKDGILSVNTTDQMERDNTLPITSAGVYATVGNIEALLKTI